MPWLKAIDVHGTAPTTAIVAFGDSITDGTCTTLDAHYRWEDIVAQRLALQGAVRHSVVNEGIGGNTVTRNVTPPPDSTPGTERLDRDVLAHAGVSHVIVKRPLASFQARRAVRLLSEPENFRCDLHEG